MEEMSGRRCCCGYYCSLLHNIYLMGRMGRILERKWFSLEQGVLSQPVLHRVAQDIVSCFDQHWTYPEVWIGTDSQITGASKRYMYSPVIVVHLGNKINKIYYTKFIRRLKKVDPSNEELFKKYNAKRLLDEGLITNEISAALVHVLSDYELWRLTLRLHYDFSPHAKHWSNDAYRAIQEYIQYLPFQHEVYFKPLATCASKAADRTVRLG